MRRIGLGVPVAVALSCAAVPAARADTLIAAADAQTSSVQPALRFGALPAMAVRQGPHGAALTSYLRFDVSALASEPAVQSAVLRLWVRAVVAPGTIEVVPVLGPWQESAITAGSGPELGAPVAVFAVEERHASQFVDVDVTGLVRDWAAGSLENHGLALRGGESVNATFHTREGFLTSHMPALEVARAGGGGVPGPAEPRAPEGGLAPHRIPTGSVMFFDLTACPQGWTALAEARGRAIVGLNPGGTLRGGWPTTFPGGGLADQAPRVITGPGAVPAHSHTLLLSTEPAHTHTVTLSAEAAHTHSVSVADHSAATLTSFGGSHSHLGLTSLAGSHHHLFPLSNGSISGPADVAFPADPGGNTSGTGDTTDTGNHQHTLQTDTESTHQHSVTVPAHGHTVTVGAGGSHAHTATVGASGVHSHTGTAALTGNTNVDVTLPYVQLLVCRKD